jgi:hypothetical protein
MLFGFIIWYQLKRMLAIPIPGSQGKPGGLVMRAGVGQNKRPVIKTAQFQNNMQPAPLRGRLMTASTVQRLVKYDHLKAI